MVYLSQIYTRSGDKGDTGLGDGSRVPKDCARVTAYGSVDELNSVLGVFLAQCKDQVGLELPSILQAIQNDLFDLGADLCLPAKPDEGKKLRIQPGLAEKLEKIIDRYNEGLQPLRTFVLPGGTTASAWCHLARTVCRRAERDVVTLMHAESINPQVVIYLNRLSDLLFVLARVLNGNGADDVLWQPGGA